MNIGIPRERFIDETRVAASPAAVRAMVEAGATVYVEQDAGAAAGWNDAEYENAGGTIVYEEAEAIGRADLVLKVLRPNEQEAEMFNDGAALISYLQLPQGPREVFDALVEREITAVALENVWYEGGGHPVRRAMSEIAGQLAVDVGSEHLRSDRGGRGILLGGLPGVPSASVGILGAGVVGTAAAAAALKRGSHVILIDQRVAPLRAAMLTYGSSLQTAIVNEHNIEKLCGFADVLVCAIMIEDHPTPHLISRELVRGMKDGGVIVDVAIDQGGTAETSRPTTISDPVYKEEGVIHYCVPNMPALVPRTATRAFQNQVLPFVRQIIREGVRETLRGHPYLRTGLNLYEGTVTREFLGRAFGIASVTIDEVLR
ncbi:MAG: Alanine dehydrogenase 2 [Calditrichaeota bacterium]|nr:Alanine dehydrogenase 2 [Calditrichota bacterium]